MSVCKQRHPSNAADALNTGIRTTVHTTREPRPRYSVPHVCRNWYRRHIYRVCPYLIQRSAPCGTHRQPCGRCCRCKRSLCFSALGPGTCRCCIRSHASIAPWLLDTSSPSTFAVALAQAVVAAPACEARSAAAARTWTPQHGTAHRCTRHLVWGARRCTEARSHPTQAGTVQLAHTRQGWDNGSQTLRMGLHKHKPEHTRSLG